MDYVNNAAAHSLPRPGGGGYSLIWPVRGCAAGLGFGRLCSKKKHIMLLAVLIFFRNYAKIMLLSENYALCHRNYAT